MRTHAILGAVILAAALTACTNATAGAPTMNTTTSVPFSNDEQACVQWMRAANTYLTHGPNYDTTRAQDALRRAYINAEGQLSIDMGLAMQGVHNLDSPDEETIRLEIVALWAVQNDCGTSGHPIVYPSPLDANPGS